MLLYVMLTRMLSCSWRKNEREMRDGTSEGEDRCE